MVEVFDEYAKVLNDKFEEVTSVSIEETANLEYDLIYRKNAIM